MKIFCSFAQTGEDTRLVQERMERVVALLTSLGHEVYCILFDAERDKFQMNGEFLKLALGNIKQYDHVLAIVTSERRSEGMLMEIGAAIELGKPIYLLQHESSVGKTYLPEIADKHKTWLDEDDLIQQLKILYSVLSK